MQCPELFSTYTYEPILLSVRFYVNRFSYKFPVHSFFNNYTLKMNIIQPCIFPICGKLLSAASFKCITAKLVPILTVRQKSGPVLLFSYFFYFLFFLFLIFFFCPSVGKPINQALLSAQPLPALHSRRKFPQPFPYPVSL